ncbi:serine hydrolase [Streptomyces netropsis]|uniref:D-alanyl-D-alanine carboxypeptidase (Penicillin-binding protein 5/6) n=1 Tax=Streptomyces netropsis TaxID=55404 RepID=A0A7W7L7F8_STRNE|nr:serine hydrolase [Streptomyces netropsis]MBB4885053.1 D-alanyl-D-alanine carboxypeptidase (penicillin-binding protein 5/6) [Streptomyces netropsis]GGR26417.1 D-alanyl-D-alanine carboxypeptidase [Streptomyces netropsis]
MDRIGGRPVRRWGTALVASTAAIAVVLPATTAEAASGPSGVTAQGAFLLDTGKNSRLWSKNADTKRQMASTTKVMTAAVVLDTSGVNLNKLVTIKQSYRDYVARNGASTADLRVGDKLTVRQLLYGLMLPSGCDAAYALADTFGSGSTEAARTKSFIGKMNKKAAALGMKNTKYDSFDGISAAGANYTTPRDTAKLAGHAMANSTFGTVVKSTSTQQKAANINRTYYWDNTNKLLGSYKGAIGIKTGTGSVAGPCLVFAAQRNGRTVVGVILNAGNRYADATKMLDWAYNTKTPVKLRQLPASAQKD